MSKKKLAGLIVVILLLLGAGAVETNVGSRETYNSSQVTYAQDKVFLPSEADVFGTSSNGSPALAGTYLTGERLPTPGTQWSAVWVDNDGAEQQTSQWLRDASAASATASMIISSSGTRTTISSRTDGDCGVRPLLWLSLVD